MPKDSFQWLMETMKLQNIFNTNLAQQQASNQEFTSKIGEQLAHFGAVINFGGSNVR